MKITAIKIKEDLLMRINRLKYQWGFKTQEDVIRHLIELTTPEINNRSAVKKTKEMSVLAGEDDSTSHDDENK